MTTIKNLLAVTAVLATFVALSTLATYLLTHAALSPVAMVLGFLALAVTGLLVGENRRLTAEVARQRAKDDARRAEERAVVDALLKEQGRRADEVEANCNAILNARVK
jgi:predicted membrane-bound spermidine synthase